MISVNQCMPLILESVPGFRDKWKAHLEWWGDEQHGLSADMSAFSHYVVDLVAKEELDDLPRIFTLVEELMVDGDQTVYSAVATCFLENLLNLGANPKHFVPLLGPKSRAFCRAWDEFTGLRTEGLW